MRWHSGPESASELAHGMRVEIVRSEGSVILLFGAALIASFDFAAAATGTVLPATYIYLDGLRCVILVVLGMTMRAEQLPVHLVPWVFVAGISANMAISNYDASVVGTGALGSVLVLIVVFGAVVSFWAPFLVGAALCVIVTAVSVSYTMPTEAVSWAFAALTAVAFSAMVLRGRLQTVRATAEARARVHEMASRDALTGLLNRRGVGEVWPLIAARATRIGAPVFAVFIDVAGLKHVNDHAGHDTGDLLLTRVVDAIRGRTRGDELLVRWGGDEFLVLGVGEAPESRALGARLLAAIDRSGIDNWWEPRLWIGTAQSDPDVALASLVSLADTRTALCTAP